MAVNALPMSAARLDECDEGPPLPPVEAYCDAGPPVEELDATWTRSLLRRAVRAEVQVGRQDELIRRLENSFYGRPQQPGQAAPATMPDPQPAWMFLAADDEPLRWLADGLLIAGGLSLVSSHPKVGKTALVEALAVAVATGQPFIGRATTQGPVLLWAMDQPARMTRERLRNLIGEGDDQAPVFIATQPPPAPDTAFDWLHGIIVRQGLQAVIVDTLVRMVPGLFARTGAESDGGYSRVVKTMGNFRAIAEATGCHIAMLHHSVKGEQNGRGIDGIGSVGLQGAVDTIISLRWDANGRQIESTQREGESLDARYFSLDGGWPLLDEPAQGAKNREYDERILEYLRQRNDGPTKAEIKHDVEGRSGQLNAALKRLIDDRRVITSGAGQRGSPLKFWADDDQ